MPLARWSCPDLATEAARRGVVASISASTVRRWLAADALKPWQHRSWIFPRDPDFGFKAGRVLDLYARFFDGQPLGADEYVLSADEKPGVQARNGSTPLPAAAGPTADASRGRVPPARHAGLPRRLRRPPRPGDRPLRPDHRHRTIHRAGHQSDDQPALRKRSAGVLDRRQRLIPPRLDRRRTTQRGVPQRDHDPHPDPRIVVEPGRIYFSVVQRKLLTPDNVAGLEQLAEQLTAFEARYNQAARPFDWRFNRDDLDDSLIDRRLTPDELTGATTSGAR